MAYKFVAILKQIKTTFLIRKMLEILLRINVQHKN